MVRDVVGNLDLLGNSVSTCSRSIARVESSIVHALAFGISVRVEAITREPVIAPARFSFSTVGTVSAGLSRHVGAIESASLEAVLSSLLLVEGGEVAWCQKLVDEVLILADTIAEHAAVVAVCVDTPLNRDDLTGSVSGNYRCSPYTPRLVVVDASTGIIAARTAPASCRIRQVWPSGNRFVDCTFGTRIQACLYIKSISVVRKSTIL